MAKVSKSAVSCGVVTRSQRIKLLVAIASGSAIAGAVSAGIIGHLNPSARPQSSQAQSLNPPPPLSQPLQTPPPLSQPLQTPSPYTPVEPSEQNPPPNSDPTAPYTAPATGCQTASPTSTNGITQLVNNISQTASWVEQPATGMGAFVGQVAPQVLAYLNPSPFPDINSLARQAKVPIMMYHDILPEKLVFFDVTPQEFEQHLQLIKQKGLTPISMDQLVVHLRTGAPLPAKPILLTFDDGYQGHYTYVYPLLKKYNYPAVFAIYTAKVGTHIGRSSLTWEQLREMAKDSLVTISSHSVNHKPMADMPSDQLVIETQLSKRILETELKIPIRYFTYPEGKYDKAAVDAVQAAGYTAALTMRDSEERLAGQSENLLTIERVGQSRLAEMVEIADGGPALTPMNQGFDFASSLRRIDQTIDQVPFRFIAGGRPVTIHAPTRAQVSQIIAGTPAIAAVDGGFFSLELLDSNEMLGPVYSQNEGQFVPGKRGEIPFLENRPLVLIGPNSVKFIPFKYQQHNTLEAMQAEKPDVTDAFVAAGWLVDSGRPQPLERFGKLYSVNEARHRAFWGINQQGQPQIGVSTEPIGAVDLGIALAKAGFRDAVMLDSGASASLAYKGELLVGYTPRPVPHVVGLVPAPGDSGAVCSAVSASTVIR